MGRKAIAGKKNYSLDCMRGIACLFVVLIHCPLPGALGEILRGMGRFAVPFFVMISGYFWYREDDGKRCQNTKRLLKGIAKLTIIGVIFCGLVNSVGSVVSGQHPFYWITSVWSKRTVLEFLLFNRAAFLSSVMYYLFGMIYTYVLVLWLDKYHLMRLSIWASPMLLAMNVLFSTVLNSPWYCAGNWLFTCVPFFAMGYYLRTRGTKLVRLPMGVWLAMFCAGVLATVGEWRLFGDVYCGVGTILISVSIFVMCLKNPRIGQKHPILVTWIRRMATGIFLVHCTFRDVLKNLWGQKLAEGCLLPLAVLVVSIVFVGIVWVVYERWLRKKK